MVGLLKGGYKNHNFVVVFSFFFCWIVYLIIVRENVFFTRELFIATEVSRCNQAFHY